MGQNDEEQTRTQTPVASGPTTPKKDHLIEKLNNFQSLLKVDCTNSEIDELQQKQIRQIFELISALWTKGLVDESLNALKNTQNQTYALLSI